MKIVVFIFKVKPAFIGRRRMYQLVYVIARDIPHAMQRLEGSEIYFYYSQIGVSVMGMFKFFYNLFIDNIIGERGK